MYHFDDESKIITVIIKLRDNFVFTKQSRRKVWKSGGGGNFDGTEILIK